MEEIFCVLLIFCTVKFLQVDKVEPQVLILSRFKKVNDVVNCQFVFGKCSALSTWCLPSRTSSGVFSRVGSTTLRSVLFLISLKSELW